VLLRPRSLAAGFALLLIAGAAGAVRHHVHWNRHPPDHVAAVLPLFPQRGDPGRPGPAARDPSAVVELEGVVASSPTVRAGGGVSYRPGGRRVGFVLEAERLLTGGPGSAMPVSGLVRVTVADPSPAPPATEAPDAPLGLSAGDRVRLTVAVRPVGGPDNPGEYDWRDRLARDRVLLAAYADRPSALVRLGRADGNRWGWDAAVAAVRRAVRRPIRDAALTEPQRNFQAALLLGDRRTLDEGLLEDLAVTGTIYFIVVSGQNVMLAVMWAFWPVRLLLGRRAGVAAGAGVLAVYLMAVDADPPILRAGVAAAVFLAGLTLGGRGRFVNTLALAAAVVLWLNPTDLFDPGALLSFLCTAALVLLGPRLLDWMLGDRRERGDDTADDVPNHALAESGHPLAAIIHRAGGYVLTVLAGWVALNLAAWIVSVPLTACLFHQVSLGNPLIGLTAAPLASTAMVAGFFGLLAGVVSPPLGELLLGVAAWSGDRFCELIRFSASVEWLHWPAVGVSAGWAAAAYGLILLWLNRRELGVPRVAVAAGAAALIALYAAGRVMAGPPAGTAHVAVLAVGHGCCVVGDSPGDGGAWMYDAGSTRPGDLARTVIRPYLLHRRRTSVGLLMLSHPDADHYNAVPSLLRRTPVGHVAGGAYFAEVAAAKPEAAAVLSALSSRGREMRGLVRGDAVTLGPALTGKVLWPPAGWTPRPYGDPEFIGTAAVGAGVADNDTSLVVSVRKGRFRVLLAGDIGAGPQAALAGDPEARCDVLLMPHHGSAVGDPAGFLRAVRPRVVIIANDHHDSPKLAGILGGLPPEVAVFHTADAGAVEMDITDSALTVRSFRDGRTVRLLPVGRVPLGR
jgi:competence protein ComEC